MITNWRVANFKSIRDGGDLALAPLTILTGANSSGKSALIQSVLLIAQTLSKKAVPASVVLNGAFESLGQFDDVRSIGSVADQIVIRGTCRPCPQGCGAAPESAPSLASRSEPGCGDGVKLCEVSFEVAFDADSASPDWNSHEIEPSLFSCVLEGILRDDDNVERKHSILVRRAAESRLSNRPAIFGDGRDAEDRLPAESGYDVTLDEVSMKGIRDEIGSAQPVGCRLRHFLPEAILFAVPPNEGEPGVIGAARQNSFRSAAGATVQSPEMLPDTGGDVPKSIAVGRAEMDPEAAFGESNGAQSGQPQWKAPEAGRQADLRSEKVEESVPTSSAAAGPSMVVLPLLPAEIAASARYVETVFGASVQYLGPARDAVRSLYSLTGLADPCDIGIHGENTASVLAQHRDRQVRYIPSAQFGLPVVDRRTLCRPLAAAVADWLGYLGLAVAVEARELGKPGCELKVELAGSEARQDLTQVGAGVGRVLPVLVMCLLAEVDSTLVLEQPELHLHPKAQTLLGDFLLSVALCGKQCLLETHSEYLIDRLRLRIASAEGEDLADIAKIFFVEKSGSDSVFREVTINEYGAIVDWPEGLFDQSQHEAEAILRAAMRKRPRGW